MDATINLDDYDTPEKVAKLGDIDPAFAKVDLLIKSTDSSTHPLQRHSRQNHRCLSISAMSRLYAKPLLGWRRR